MLGSSSFQHDASRRRSSLAACLMYLLAFLAAIPPGFAEQFVLRDETQDTYHGPYNYRDGEQILDGRMSLALETNRTFRLKAYPRGIMRYYGPFAYTNRGMVTVENARLQLLCGAEMRTALAALSEQAARRAELQRQALAVTQAIEMAKKQRHYEDAIATLRSVLERNPKAENASRATALLNSYTQQLKYERAQAAKGLVKVDGQWVTTAQAEIILQEKREAEQMDHLLRDAGLVANAFVQQQIDTGVLQSAQFVGYQRGLSVPLVAIYKCSFISRGGFHRTTMCSAALRKDNQGRWSVEAFLEDAGVFQGLPLHSDWRSVR